MCFPVDLKPSLDKDVQPTNLCGCNAPSPPQYESFSLLCYALGGVESLFVKPGAAAISMKQTNKNAYRRTKKKAERSVTALITASSARRVEVAMS
jgi:hypothetical protein